MRGGDGEQLHGGDQDDDQDDDREGMTVPITNEQVASAAVAPPAAPVLLSLGRAAIGAGIGIAQGIIGAVLRDRAAEETVERWRGWFRPDPPPTVGDGGDDPPAAAPPRMLPMWTADP